MSKNNSRKQNKFEQSNLYTIPEPLIPGHDKQNTRDKRDRKARDKWRYD